MARTMDVMVTALAPAIWGSTYLVTTEFLPHTGPLTVAALRALPPGLLLLALVRQLPWGVWWGRVFVLGALNFAIFWAMLFVSAYRLPGGVAATLGAVQPLIVLFLARALLGNPVNGKAVAAGVAGLVGVGALILKPTAALDPLGIAAALAGAVSMAAGTVLSRRWQPPVSALTFTAWQLTAGGLLLLPTALWFEPLPVAMPVSGTLAIAYLGLIGAGLTYLLWFRGLARLGPGGVAPLGFLSPVTAVALGWLVLGQPLTPVQLAGFALVLGGVWFGQSAARKASVRNADASCQPSTTHSPR